MGIRTSVNRNLMIPFMRFMRFLRQGLLSYLRWPAVIRPLEQLAVFIIANESGFSWRPPGDTDSFT